MGEYLNIPDQIYQDEMLSIPKTTLQNIGETYGYRCTCDKFS
jgi:hypothetical protein